MVIGNRNIKVINVTDENNVLIASITDENVITNGIIKVSLVENAREFVKETIIQQVQSAKSQALRE